MKPSFSALIPVLNFSHQPDSSGLIIPPEAHVTFQDLIPITYGNDEYESVVGKANLTRSNNQLIADMFIFSTHKNISKSEKLIKRLYPAVELTIYEQIGQAVFKCDITGLFLTTYKNHDKKIKPLGEALIRVGGVH